MRMNKFSHPLSHQHLCTLDLFRANRQHTRDRDRPGSFACLRRDDDQAKLTPAAQGRHNGAPGDRFMAQNYSLKMLLQYTYDLNEDSIVGIPSQLDSKRFDIKAKISDPDLDALKKLSEKQGRLMVLPLLTERFQLKTHMETRPGPVYELVVAKGGPKLKPSADKVLLGLHLGHSFSRGNINKITANCVANSIFWQKSSPVSSIAR